MTPFISGEFTVSDIKRANYSELFPCEEDSADRWFKCKLYFITSDEKSGAEKKTATNVLCRILRGSWRAHNAVLMHFCNCRDDISRAERLLPVQFRMQSMPE